MKTQITIKLNNVIKMIFISPDIKVFAYSINKEDFFPLLVVGGENILFCLAHFLLVTGIFFVVALYIYEHELSVLAPRLVWGKDLIVEEWLSGSLYDLQAILFWLPYVRHYKPRLVFFLPNFYFGCGLYCRLFMY